MIPVIFPKSLTIDVWQGLNYASKCVTQLYFESFKSRALCNLVPFVQFKKRVKAWKLLYLTKSNTPPWVFFTFLKLYSWYQIVQTITNIYYAKLIGLFPWKGLVKMLSLVGKHCSLSYNRGVTATVVFAGHDTTKQRNIIMNTSDKINDLETSIGKFSTMQLPISSQIQDADTS